ncbi:hypothetical protein JCM10207_009298 [Rhodosporidiobolus poonsookiae]
MVRASVLAFAAALTATSAPAPTPAPMLRRGWFDDIFGDDNSTSSATSTTTESAEQQAEDEKRSTAAINLLSMIALAKEQTQNSTSCASDCQDYWNATSCYVSSISDAFTGDNTTDATCASNFDGACSSASQKAMNSCASCVGGNNTEAASNVTYLCTVYGYTAVDNDSAAGGLSALLSKAGLAASLVAGGLAALAF